MSTGRITVGHPVDVGSGAVYTLSTDFRVPGSLGMGWRRYYSTAATGDNWLGTKWTVPYFMRLERGTDRYVLNGAHGEEVYFPSPVVPLRVGAKLSNLTAKMELFRDRDQYHVLHWHTGGPSIRFCFKPAAEGNMALTAIENLLGHRVRLDYDAAHRPVRLVQELEQRTIEITYDRRNLISAIHFAGASGRKLLVQYEYDANRRLVAALNAMGQRKEYEYDRDGRMIAEGNPLGSRFVFQYDRQGRCTFTAGSDGFLERKLKYLGTPRMTRVTDSRGGVTEYYLNAAGQVLQIVGPLGAVTTNAFDEHGRLIEVIHPDGAKESFAYDAAGNLASKVDPSGAATTTEHDKNHVPTKRIDRNGYPWDLAGDNPAGLLGIEGLPARGWVYTRDDRGLVIRAESPQGRRIDARRDPRFRWQENRDQLSLLSRTEFDDMGYATEIQDAMGGLTRTRYDDLHRPREVAHAAGGLTRYWWNGVSALTERVGPGDRRDTWVYDAYGHVSLHVDNFGDVASFEYDQEGKLTSVVNRVGERLEYRRDAAGRVVEESLFDGRVQRYEYDPAGRRVKIHLSDGRTISQRFDPAGRLLTRLASDGLVEEFAYDGEGRIVNARNNHTAVEFVLDPAGNILTEVQNGRRVEYWRDADGRRIGRLLPFETAGGKLRRTFDTRGRLLSLRDERGVCQEFRWDELDRLIERRCPGGVSEVFTYTAQRHLHEHRVEARRGGFARIHTHDARGNLSTLRDGRSGAFEYAYDQIDRLTAVRREGILVESYDYDANGAIRATQRGPRRLAPGGKPLQDGARELVYGGDGAVNAIRMGSSEWLLKHDVNGRLAEVIGPDGRVVRYEYDPFGRRTAKIVEGDRTEFLWELWHPAAELRDGAARRIYDFMDFRPLAEWQGGERMTPILDHRGAVREVFDDSGGLRWSCSLDAYGNLLAESGDAPSPFRLRGQYHDAETGLYYNNHRYYDPQVGDYTAPDPIGFEGGFHFSAYPRNPLRLDDPYGLECVTDENDKPIPFDDDRHPKPANSALDPRTGQPWPFPPANASNEAKNAATRNLMFQMGVDPKLMGMEGRPAYDPHLPNDQPGQNNWQAPPAGGMTVGPAIYDPHAAPAGVDPKAWRDASPSERAAAVVAHEGSEMQATNNAVSNLTPPGGQSDAHKTACADAADNTRAGNPSVGQGTQNILDSQQQNAAANPQTARPPNAPPTTWPPEIPDPSSPKYD